MYEGKSILEALRAIDEEICRDARGIVRCAEALRDFNSAMLPYESHQFWIDGLEHWKISLQRSMRLRERQASRCVGSHVDSEGNRFVVFFDASTEEWCWRPEGSGIRPADRPIFGGYESAEAAYRCAISG